MLIRMKSNTNHEQMATQKIITDTIHSMDRAEADTAINNRIQMMEGNEFVTDEHPDSDLDRILKSLYDDAEFEQPAESSAINCPASVHSSEVKNRGGKSSISTFLPGITFLS